MKPMRFTKFRSNLSFLKYLSEAWLRQTVPLIAPSDRIGFPTSEDHEIASYYCKLTEPFFLSDSKTLKDFPFYKKTGYNFDFYRMLEIFPDLKFQYLIGDIQTIPDEPSFLRCRQIHQSDFNKTCVLLPLNTRRLFNKSRDPFSYDQKKPLLVWRGAAFKKHRIDFLRATRDKTMFNTGAVATNQADGQEFLSSWLTPAQQMAYKFIFIIEGNDIASNIQWAMASNSLCMMRKPRFESWFAEGRLIADVHYVEVKDDFSNIKEKISYYMDNPACAKLIIDNAKAYVSKFDNLNQQYRIGRAVIEKYQMLCLEQ